MRVSPFQKRDFERGKTTPYRRVKKKTLELFRTTPFRGKKKKKKKKGRWTTSFKAERGRTVRTVRTGHGSQNRTVGPRSGRFHAFFAWNGSLP